MKIIAYIIESGVVDSGPPQDDIALVVT